MFQKGKVIDLRIRNLYSKTKFVFVKKYDIAYSCFVLYAMNMCCRQLSMWIYWKYIVKLDPI